MKLDPRQERAFAVGLAHAAPAVVPAPKTAIAADLPLRGDQIELGLDLHGNRVVLELLQLLEGRLLIQGVSGAGMSHPLRHCAEGLA
jgi:hypothetical protein